MSEDPTDVEISRLLEQMESVLVAHKHTAAPQHFAIIWRRNLHDFAFMKDRVDEKVLVLVDNGNEYVWQEV